MSYSQIPLNILQSLDCVTDLNAPLDYCVQKGGGSDNYYTKFNVSGGTPNTSQNTFNINPNSPNVIVDRRIYLDNTYTIILTGTNPATINGEPNTVSRPVYQPGLSGALRQFPIMSCIKSLSISLNDSVFSTNVNEYISAFYKYMDDELKEFNLSTSPSMDDKFQNYVDGVGSNLNPLAIYGNSGNGVPTRGGFSIKILPNAVGGLVNPSLAPGATGSATLQVRIVEPMMLSPLWFGKGSPKGLIGMQTMTVNYVYDSGCISLWSQSTGSTIVPLQPSTGAIPSALLSQTAGISVTADLASIWVLQYTPRLVEPIPQQLAWPFSNITPYTSALTTIPGWAQAGPAYQINNPQNAYVKPEPMDITVSGINLSSVPERLYIFARPQNSNISGNAYASNSFGVITNVTITWDGRNLLSQCYDSQLYEFCQANGNNQNWDAFSNYEGSVVTVDFAKQIGCSSLQAPGLLSRSVLSVKATVVNTNAGLPLTAITAEVQPTNYILYVVVIEGGIAGVIDGHTIKQIGILSAEDVLNSDSAPYSYDHRDLTVFGSSFLSDIFSGLKKGFSTVADVLPKAVGIFKTAKEFAPLLGFGATGGRRRRSHSRGRGMTGGRSRSRSRSHSRGRVHGRGLEEDNKGGKLISRKDLLNRKQNKREVEV